MVVDLDKLDSWPGGLIDAIEPFLSDIENENEVERAFNVSGDRWFEPAPDMPAKNAALTLIANAMIGQDLRVFHATRLIDPDAIHREGLRPLSIEAQLKMVRSKIVEILSAEEIDTLDCSIRSINLNDRYFSVRHGQVWFTPLRRKLYDGGCDVFFNHFGGEAIQRIAKMATPAMMLAIRKLGVPAVVVARIPAFGCCTFGDLQLAPAMLARIQEERNNCPEIGLGWDVLVKHAVPKEWIEVVLPRGDHSQFR
jgi:hypothetical protein